MFEQNIKKLHYHHYHGIYLKTPSNSYLYYDRTLTGECGYGGVVLPELGEAAADGEEPPAGEHHAVCSRHVGGV